MQFAKMTGVQNIRTDKPIVGGGIITAEGPTGHIIVIVSIDEVNQEFLVIESNYKKCAITYRRISFSYSRILYFVK